MILIYNVSHSSNGVCYKYDFVREFFLVMLYFPRNDIATLTQK